MVKNQCRKQDVGWTPTFKPKSSNIISHTFLIYKQKIVNKNSFESRNLRYLQSNLQHHVAFKLKEITLRDSRINCEEELNLETNKIT